jgi:arylsulfatase A-like enzyme
VFVHYYDVHYPYMYGEPYDSMYRDDDLDITGSVVDGFRVIQALKRGNPEAQAMSDARKAACAGGVTYTDAQIGRLIDGFRSLGLLDETLLIITSDHGESMDAHAQEYWDHGRTVFEETVHIPLIMRFPRAWRGGARIGHLIANIDVAPTLLDLLGLSLPSGVEGRSFAPLLTGADRPIRETVFVEATKPHGKRYERGTVWRNERKMRGVRTTRWKLLHEPLGDRAQLYDLRTDRSEQNDLARAAAGGAAITDLKERLNAWAAGPATSETRANLDKSTRKQLRALGYAE